MRVRLGRRAMRRPSGVADTGGAGERRPRENAGQIAQFAFGTAPLDLAVDQGSDTGAVIAAIFQTTQ